MKGTGAYWSASFALEHAAQMHEKYRALLEALALPNPVQRDRALRGVAEQWPGALREAQLVDPAAYARRHAITAPGAGAGEQPRSWWAARGAAAVVLWADLHLMLTDQRVWRRQSLGGRSARGLAHPVRAFMEALGPHAQCRWRGGDAYPAETRVDGRWARQILAARADLAPETLDRWLLEGPE